MPAATGNAPKLEGSKWSPQFRDLLTKALVVNQQKRATAADLLAHPFFKQAIASDEKILKAIKGCQHTKAVQNEMRGIGFF